VYNHHYVTISRWCISNQSELQNTPPSINNNERPDKFPAIRWRAKPFWVDGTGHNNTEALVLRPSRASFVDTLIEFLDLHGAAARKGDAPFRISAVKILDDRILLFESSGKQLGNPLAETYARFRVTSWLQLCSKTRWGCYSLLASLLY